MGCEVGYLTVKPIFLSLTPIFWTEGLPEIMQSVVTVFSEKLRIQPDPVRLHRYRASERNTEENLRTSPKVFHSQ